MPFDISTWKTQISEKMSGWRARMQSGGVESVYFFVAATSLLPILQAAQSGDWRALVSLGTVLGGAVSTNLLANLLQKLKDKSDVEASEILQSEVESLPELQSAIDVLLEKLDSLPRAKLVLADEDKLWFNETIRQELAQLKSRIHYDANLMGNSAIAQGNGNQAVAPGSIGMYGDQNGIFIQGNHNRLNIIGPSQDVSTLAPLITLRCYLDNIITTHQHLRLQGISTGNQPLSVSLEKTYISLNVVDKLSSENDNLIIKAALDRYHRIVIIGDPGSGKTTLLSYIALTYARSVKSFAFLDKGEDALIVEKRLQLRDESDFLPIFLPLRNLGLHLKIEHPDSSKDGPAILLNYLFEYYQTQLINLPGGFFDDYLNNGKAVVLLDGVDEIAETRIRQRVARMIEQFSARYPGCRFIVTSREFGYKGPYRIGAEYGLVKLREFDSRNEVPHFVKNWTRAVETALANSDSPKILLLADKKAEQLIRSINGNYRVAELAINPLLITVIAIVHRYRNQLLPMHRWELYKEAVEVLLGQWDSAKGIETEFKLAGHAFDISEQRSLLELIAFWLHQYKLRDIELDDLRTLLYPKFFKIADRNTSEANKMLDAFLRLINERSGLLVERNIGIYGFVHLTFQEYLTARVLAERKNAVAFSLRVLTDPWWREVLLLEANYLGEQGIQRVSKLLQAILDAKPKSEPEPYYRILFVAECLFDIGPMRVDGDLLGQIQNRLQKQIDIRLDDGDRAGLLAKITAINALSRIENKRVDARFWNYPYGEPDWVTIPMGEFWMGNDDQDEDDEYIDEKPLHRLYLSEYQIGRVPVTNAQYALYIHDTDGTPPDHWHGRSVPPGRENHPVVNVSWENALSYCLWLSKKINKKVALPSEAQWEKAARGDQDERIYPWGYDWKELRCNSDALGLNDTIQVGLFLDGESPYGVLDMSGNVWEWTCTIRDDKFKYPYKVDDGRENLWDNFARVLRGGSYYNSNSRARCTSRYWYPQNKWDFLYGFRVAIPSIAE